MLAVHAGREQRIWTEGSVTHCEFRRGFPSLRFDPDMAFDLAFALRHLAPLRRSTTWLRAGRYSYHWPQRLWLPGNVTRASGTGTDAVFLAYESSRVRGPADFRHGFQPEPRSPNGLKTLRSVCWASTTVTPEEHWPRIPELVELVSKQTGKPSGLMERGIDTALFHPVKRMRELDTMFRIGYVGRLSREKNVRMLVEIQALLQSAQAPPFQFCIVGQGDEQQFLERHLQDAFFRGVLHGKHSPAPTPTSTFSFSLRRPTPTATSFSKR